MRGILEGAQGLTSTPVGGCGMPYTRHGDRAACRIRGGISFIQEFHSGVAMVISFPGGNEPPWRFSLQGTAAMVSAMLRCMSAMRRPPDQTTQPFRAPSSEPTQPFALRPRFPQEAVPDAMPADRQ
jgi:hypothetical protein